jgi:hypothetical protein
VKTLDTIKLIEASGLPTSQRMLLVSLAMLALVGEIHRTLTRRAGGDR